MSGRNPAKIFEQQEMGGRRQAADPAGASQAVVRTGDLNSQGSDLPSFKGRALAAGGEWTAEGWGRSQEIGEGCSHWSRCGWKEVCMGDSRTW